MLVLLRTLRVGDVHALARQLAATELTDAGDDVGHRLLGIELEEGRPVVAVGVGAPGVDHRLQVGEQQIGRDGEVLAAPIGVGGVDVVGHGTGAGAVLAEVLTPQEELDRVPAGGDVGLAARLVERRQQLGIDRGVGGRVVDDARLGIALDVVDVGLVHRPGVDEALGPVLLVVDRSTVEAERLGEPVVVAGVEPGLLGRLERGVAGSGHEGVDRLVHRRRRCQAGGVRGVDAVGVGVDGCFEVGPVVSTTGAEHGDGGDDGEQDELRVTDGTHGRAPYT